MGIGKRTSAPQASAQISEVFEGAERALSARLSKDRWFSINAGGAVTRFPSVKKERAEGTFYKGREIPILKGVCRASEKALPQRMKKRAPSVSL